MFAKIFIFAVVLQLALSRPQGSDEDEGRIVGGAPTSITNYPYQIAVAFGNFVCGGTLIDTNVVVTAAHCTDHDATTRAGAVVRAGSSNYYDGEEISVKQIFDHPQYNSQITDNDISVLQLSDHFQLGQNIDVIGIASYPRQSGDTCTIAGWGLQAEGVKNSISTSQLKSVDIPFITTQDCRTNSDYVKYYNDMITDSMVCAGNINRNSDNTCQGDSGGGLVNDGELVGVVSWARGCATAGTPTVFANVFGLSGFIFDTVDYIHANP